MKQVIALCAFFLSSIPINAQLACKELKDNSGTKKTCLHSNGKVSTLETWDKEKREGQFKGFNNEGKVLFHFYLRRFAGHASVYPQYFKNGQISKIEYSSAPDGGIQFYRETITYTENGTVNGGWKHEHPDVLTTEPSIRIPEKKIEPKKDSITPKSPAQCAVPYLSIYTLVNTSRRKVTVELKAKNNLWSKRQDKILTLKAGQKAVIDSVILAEHFLKPEEAYNASIKGSSNKTKGLKLILEYPVSTNSQNNYWWYVVKVD